MMATAVRERIVGGDATGRREVRGPTGRELELGGIIDAYNAVTERLKRSHDALTVEVRRLREQLKAKDEELRRRERLAALGEMAAGMAHEIRNPLGGILLYAQMLEDDTRDRPAACSLAGQIAGASRKLDAIIADILAFADGCALRLGPVSLVEAVGEVVELLRPVWTTKGCGVSVAVSAGDVVIEGDGSQLRRAVLNVVCNAVEAAGPGGMVRVEVGRSEGERGGAWVDVSDSGPGVPEELRDRVFNPFFTTKDSGTGLGLAIVHRIIDLHGGRVVIGESELGGAQFRFELPLGSGRAGSRGVDERSEVDG